MVRPNTHPENTDGGIAVNVRHEEVPPAVSPVHASSLVSNISQSERLIAPADWIKLLDYFNAEVIVKRLERLELNQNL